MKSPAITAAGQPSVTLYIPNIPSLERQTKPNLKKTLLGEEALALAQVQRPNLFTFLFRAGLTRWPALVRRRSHFSNDSDVYVTVDADVARKRMIYEICDAILRTNVLLGLFCTFFRVECDFEC